MADGWTTDITNPSPSDTSSVSIWIKVRERGPFRYIWTRDPRTGETSRELTLSILGAWHPTVRL